MFVDFMLEKDARTPERANPTDAGLDLFAKQDYQLTKGVRVLVDTGVSIAIPKGMMGMLVPRSSLSKRNIIMTNSIGIIDSDYRGNLMASLMYIGNPELSHDITDYIHISKGDKIVQIVLVPIVVPYMHQVHINKAEWQGSTARGIGGFGSTGS